ncbi:MAG TPA: DNA repair protein RadC [Dissulfurispiraceae bacterium]|nr:DNA repair protein RadC [Dissulfurispiraceae bacterium]
MANHQSIKEWPEAERPRERLLKHGAENLSDAQLLAILLRTGNKDASAVKLGISLLDAYKTLHNIESAALRDMQMHTELKGIGPAKLAQLKAAFELGRRLLREESGFDSHFSSGHEVHAYFASRFRHLKKELFVALFLDAKNKLIREYKVSEGTLTNSLIHPREAFKQAIKESAASVIFVHNHPSGDPTPSRDDLAVTRRLKDVGELVGIAVLDHIIIGDGAFVSLKEKGVL